MSAVGHYLEAEGIATASISLVREHSEVMRPPRALWVPFMLGRPLGAPNDPVFQRTVLLAVLQLFERRTGPVLEDFPQEAPASASLPDDDEGDACPVNFSRPQLRAEGEHALAKALQEEIAQLRPWHDMAVGRRGGSSVGASGLTPEAAGAFAVSFLGASAPVSYLADETLGQALKFAADDLRAYYEEAATAQPGDLSAGALQRWFYRQTVAGEVILAVRQAGLAGEDASVRFVAERVLIPRAVLMGP